MYFPRKLLQHSHPTSKCNTQNPPRSSLQRDSSASGSSRARTRPTLRLALRRGLIGIALGSRTGEGRCLNIGIVLARRGLRVGDTRGELDIGALRGSISTCSKILKNERINVQHKVHP